MNNRKHTQLLAIFTVALISTMILPAYAASPNDVVADTTAAASEVISVPEQISEQCGDVELMFMIDDTGSMAGTLANIGAGAAAIVASVEASLIAGADAKYGVGTFKDDVTVVQPLDTNSALTTAVLGSLVASGGAGGPEASDMAKQTAIDALPAGSTADQDGFLTTINGGMTVPFSSDPTVTKAIILITDNVPGGGNDANSVNDNTHLTSLGTQAGAAGIKVYDLIRGVTASDAFYMADATNSGGAFNMINLDGTGVADTIIDIITDPDFCVEITGGELLTIDNSALLIAGASANAVWILPMLAGLAGAGIYLTRSKFNWI